MRNGIILKEKTNSFISLYCVVSLGIGSTPLPLQAFYKMHL